MLRITITDYNKLSKEEAIEKFIDSRYVICYSEETSKDTIFCKTKDEVFAMLAKDHEDITVILELYEPSVEKDTISFLTKDFQQDN